MHWVLPDFSSFVQNNNSMPLKSTEPLRVYFKWWNRLEVVWAHTLHSKSLKKLQMNLCVTSDNVNFWNNDERCCVGKVWALRTSIRSNYWLYICVTIITQLPHYLTYFHWVISASSTSKNNGVVYDCSDLHNLKLERLEPKMKCK